MSYLNKYQWELIPENLPKVERGCPKCNKKTYYINSEKFRVNANKNNIDVWMIYQCEKCKSIWNMTIYERIKPHEINKYEYEKFISNSKELVRKYAFDISIYNANKADYCLKNINYKMIIKKLEKFYIEENMLVIEVISNYPIEMRIDKFISDKFGISRSKIKNMHKKGQIFIKNNKNTLDARIRNGMELHLKII
ncbi:DUF1062 domain-containing protein [Clostridium sp. SHJSY1]|uniref:DUF1062 domain-containing protein n=1 Tax=Clostridium sp. SHJSY1 TaxID=2942483 RepID=UPI002874E18D|nr:DUF1062 domain-containing protein [Clostridium sp. SHJSY1]MDS0525670.1 DUF1062 domain-containing protein [Clostridium sp. SHJSY1]